MNKILIFIVVIFLSLYKTNVEAGINTVNILTNTIEITGTGFGINTVDTEWLKDNIENGTNNTELSLPLRWSKDNTTTVSQSPLYSFEESYSGTKSIKSYFPLQTQYNSGFSCEKTETFNSVYVTYWVKAKDFEFTQPNTTGQWKMFRITPNVSNGLYGDQKNNWYFSHQFLDSIPTLEYGNDVFLNFCVDNNTPTYDTSCYAGENTGVGIYRNNTFKTNVWQRVEIISKQSDVGAMNGTIQMIVHRTYEDIPTPPVNIINYKNNVCTRNSNDTPWKNVVFQNYLGNGVDYGNIYIDDVYIQFDSQARVEIGNNSDYDNCTHREVQPLVSWTDDSIVTVTNIEKFNKDENLYLFIINNNGEISDSITVDPFSDLPTTPEINNINKNNNTITLSGYNFGINDSTTEWLGDWIENGNVGEYFSKPRWDADIESASMKTPEYSNLQAHSGTKSILSSFPIESQYDSGFSFDNGSGFNEIFVSYWLYFDHVDSAGQWKQWRLRPNSGYGDTYGEIMSSQWYNSDGSNMQNYVMLFCDPGNYQQCYPDGVSHYNPPNSLIPPKTWIRVDIHAIGSSVDGAKDGSLKFTYSIPGVRNQIIRDHSENIITRLAGSQQWRYFMFQNYWGNISSGDGTKEKIFIDDIYIQTNGSNRVEIGNSLIYENCTHKEIQPFTSWSNSSIVFNLNKGSLGNGTNYLFIIDKTGSVSNGYPIVFTDNNISSQTKIIGTKTVNSTIR